MTIMALTRGFRVTLLARAQKDAGVRKAMLKEGIDTMLAGDVETGKAILRDLYQRGCWFWSFGRGGPHTGQKSHAHVWPQGKPAGG